MKNWIYCTNRDSGMVHIVLTGWQIKTVCGWRTHPEWTMGPFTDTGDGVTCTICLRHAEANRVR